MKILILSDLHLEFFNYKHIYPDQNMFDLVILGGDISNYIEGIQWARSFFPQKEIIYILGNHEFYGHDYKDTIKACSRIAFEKGIHILHDRELVLDNIQFLGTTLWTDFSLYGKEFLSAEIASRSISDFRRIININSAGPIRNLTPYDVVDFYNNAYDFLSSNLKKENTFRKKVVISHFVPFEKSIHEKYKSDNCNPYFCTNIILKLEKVRVPIPDLWIHGHTHDSSDYMYKDTRVLCNPRGYGKENSKNFNPNLIVEI